LEDNLPKQQPVYLQVSVIELSNITYKNISHDQYQRIFERVEVLLL
jgi:hypothetical protein